MISAEDMTIVGEKTTGRVADKVLELIAKSKRIPAESVTLDSTLEELRIDSLDGLNLFFDLEEAFDVNIPDDRARTMRTVREIVEGLEQLVASKSASNAASPVQN